MRHVILALACAAACAACSPDPQPVQETAPPPPPVAEEAPVSASVALQPTEGNAVSGMLTLSADAAGVRIEGAIDGLQPEAQHGFHVHETGDCSAADASSAGGHFNPDGHPHGDPTGEGPRHLGDMQNLQADADGHAAVSVVIDGATLHSGLPTDLVGKAVIVHEKADDYQSQPTGDAGSRVACGVIEGR